MPYTLDDLDKVIAKAQTYVGQREVGHNAGRFVSTVLASVGLKPGYAWCASFVSYVFQGAGIKTGPRFGRAAVRNWASWAGSLDLIKKSPERGDLMYWLNDDGTGHIGFVTGISAFGAFINTIEGNTNFAGSREGDGVYAKSRVLSPGMRFIRWRLV